MRPYIRFEWRLVLGYYESGFKSSEAEEKVPCEIGWRLWESAQGVTPSGCPMGDITAD
jgi:hypothetical protein